MSLFTAIAGLFKRTSDVTGEDKVHEFRSAPSNVVTSSDTTTTTAPVFTSSTGFTEAFTTATASTDVGNLSIEVSSPSMEDGCACGGSCTCKEEPEQEVVDSSIYDFHSGAPPTIQATLSGMDEIPVVTKQESVPTVHKIEDASTLPSVSPEKLKQPKLPGFEEGFATPFEATKRATSKKASTKLARKSTVKRKKK